MESLSEPESAAGLPVTDAEATTADAEAASDAAGEDTVAAEAPLVVDPDDILRQSLPLDIATSDYYALLNWVRSLDLDETGSAAELRQRLYQHFDVTAPAAAAAASRTIAIESADETEFFSGSDDGASYIRLSGNVALLVTDEVSGATHSVKADEIIYNRDANQMIARGHIFYERANQGSTDIFMGDVLTIDLDDWSGIFVDGRNTKGGDSEAQFVFEANEIIRRSETVMVFRDGVISSAGSDESNFTIRADRIWILGGKEWAISNATLYVGELPVLYIPFFYYPGQEIVFHPVFGFRDIEGRFVQTTTYLVGAKPPKEETISLFNLVEGDDGYVRRVEGIFLQNTEERQTATNADVIKVFADLYANLGGHAGILASLATLGPLESLRGQLSLGYSRSVFKLADGSYSPFVIHNDFDSSWNIVDYFGVELPVRLLADLAFNARLGPFAFSTALAFLSDPWVSRDFMQRSEDMDWLSFLRQPAVDSPPGKRTTFVQRLDARATFSLPELSPWLTTLSLSSLQTALTWLSKPLPSPTDATELVLFRASPTNEFFVPDTWSVLNASLALGGRLLEYPPSPRPRTPAAPTEQTAPDTAPAAAPTLSPDEPLTDWPALLLPWDSLDGAETPPPADLDTNLLEPDFHPDGALAAAALINRKPFTAALSWRLNPTFKWDTRFITAAWLEPADVDWSVLYELQNLSLTGGTNLALTVFDNLLSTTIDLSGSTAYQARPRYTEDTAYVSAALLAAWRLQDAQYRRDSLSGNLTMTSSPLQDFWLLAPTALTWKLQAALYDYRYLEMASGLPVYESLLPEWTEERIKVNSLQLDLVVRPFDYQQTLTIQASLPPVLESYSLSLASRWPYGSLAFQTGLRHLTADATIYTWNPVVATLILGQTPWPVLTSTFNWDIEAERPTNLNLALTWNGLRGNLRFAYDKAYQLDADEGWVAQTEAFQAADLAIYFNHVFRLPPLWFDRIQFSSTVTAEARQSFLRFSTSSLSLNLSFSFKIFEFLELTFSSVSYNSSMWRYYSDLFVLPAEFGNLEPINPIVDILNGFRFFDADDSLRRASLFKLKSLSLDLVHYMEDWNLTFNLTATPYLNTEIQNYEFRTTFTVKLAWLAVPEIKTEVQRTGEVYTW